MDFKRKGMSMNDVLEKGLMDVLDLLQPNPVDFAEDYHVNIANMAKCISCDYGCEDTCAAGCYGGCKGGCGGGCKGPGQGNRS
jgi:hypothetical protein